MRLAMMCVLLFSTLFTGVAQADLTGDSVQFVFHSFPTWNTVQVGPAIEYSDTRWQLDIAASKVTLTSKLLADYGAAARLRVQDLNPKCADGSAAVVSGFKALDTVASFNPSSSVTYAGGTLEIKIADGQTRRWNRGEKVEVDLEFSGCQKPPAVDPCCPPWNPELLETMLYYEGSGGIASPYTLKFKPTAAFAQQIQAYIDYLHAVNAAIQSIVIHFRLDDLGTGSTPASGGPTIAQHWVEWSAGGNGTPTNGAITFFAPSLMTVGKWYRVHTGIYLAPDGVTFFSRECADNDVLVRVQVQRSAARATARQGLELEFRLDDGQVSVRSIGASPTRTDPR